MLYNINMNINMNRKTNEVKTTIKTLLEKNELQNYKTNGTKNAKK